MDFPTEHAFGESTLEDFTRALASAQPVPGGGSASAVAASLGASLLAMVASLSRGRPKYAAYSATHERAYVAGEREREHLIALADEDAAAFQRFAAVLKLPRDDEEKIAARDAAIRDAAVAAARVPLEAVRVCQSLLVQLEAMAGRSNLNAASDLDVGALLCEAAARGAGANVTINLGSVPETAETTSMQSELRDRLAAIAEAAALVHEVVRAGTLREPEAA
jgi:formiminotetrahydrofolate cyclodeaminase